MREQRTGLRTALAYWCGAIVLALGVPAIASGPGTVKLTVVDANGNTLSGATVAVVGMSDKTAQPVQVGKGTWVIENPGEKISLFVSHDRLGGVVDLRMSKNPGEAAFDIVVGPTGVMAQAVAGARPASPSSVRSLSPSFQDAKANPGQSYSRAGCAPDFSVAGAGTHMGNTCGQGNDCAFRASVEHTYEVTIPSAGVWTFATCGSPFDTVIYLSTACCGGTTIASNDDACAPGSSISPSLTAGTYYLNIEAFSSGGCGDYTLNITGPPVCNTDFTVNGPGTFMGDTCGAGNNCPLRASTDHIYQITLPNDGEWTFSLCGATWDTYLFVGTDCCGGVVASNDDSCGLASEVTANLTAGTYYVMVEAFSGTGCGAYTLDVSKAPPPPGCVGDTCAAATSVPGIPFNDTGNTCDCADDYDEDCPYTEGGSGDKVYSYTPTQDECVDIFLCNGSNYDSKMYVYENSCGPYDSGNFYACNDDACSSPNFPAPYVSRITGVDLTAGNTYYIVVDGYADTFIGPQCGDYVIDIMPCAGPCVQCSPAATPENEPNCGLPTDTVNAGCNNPIIPGGIDCCTAGACTDQDCFDAVCACDSFCCGSWDSACAGPNPFVPGCSALDLCSECAGEPEFRFTEITCGEEVCGSGATDDFTGFRDTDWFEVTVAADTEFTWTVTPSFPAVIGHVPTTPQGSGNCADAGTSLDPFDFTEVGCEELSVTICLPPGTHWFFVAPIGSAVCESEYTAALTCVGCVAPEPPPNDDCADAITVAVPSVTAGSTILGQVDPFPFCQAAGTPTAAGVWYSVIGTGNTITASTCSPNTDYDTKLSVYCPSCEDPFCAAGDDDFCGFPPGHSQVSWCSAIGAEYLILVHGFGAEDGNFELSVSEDGAACGNPPSCARCPGEGDCCLANTTPGCNDETCCNTVCDCDPFCCDVAWDQDCADGSVGFGVPGCNALALCEVCAPPPPTGACCDGLACSIQTEADCDAAGDRYLGDGASCVGAAGTPTTYASGPVGTDIPDGDPAGISHIINVPDSFIMGDANVGVVIPHTWVGDLIITVEHNATVATIVDRMGAAGSGFGCPSNDLNIDLDDQGTGGAVEDLCGPSDADPTPTSPPNYVPNNPLSVFAGMDAAGDWTITVSDNAGFDTGVLDSWSLVLDRVGENPCIPHGACCLWPDSCADDTQDECLAQQGVYLGDDTVCVIPGPVQSYSADAGIDIPDGGGQGDSISHTINVPASLNIIDTDVDVVINHTWIGDLVISVEHNATTVVIVDQPGVPASVFGCNSNDLNIILDDTGTGGPVETLCGPSDASPTPTSPPNYGPNNPLSAFNGMDAAGPWTITVYDNADFDIGTLVSWSLHFATPGADACEDVAFLGACCNGNTGTCQDGVLEADCDGSLQTWYKVTLCDEIECEAVVGACCITQTGVCTDGVTQSACPGVWTQGALCSQVSCQPPPTGACCDRDLSVCTDGVTQANCTGEWSQGVLCANVDPPCISFVPIPTVSEWGLVVLSLLLLIGMKFYFGTRREAQSA